MNIQKIFEAVRNEPEQLTLIVAVSEFEGQGYVVTINNKYQGSKDLILADERNELKYLATINGVIIRIKSDDEEQTFRMHFLDIDSIAFTEIKSLPIQYNPHYTIGLFKEQ